MTNLKMLITGGSGLLGQYIRNHYSNCLCPAHKELDITQPIKLKDDINIVLHCAAIKTNECDKDRNLAMKTNIVGTANVADYCHNNNCKLVYISTDYVFKGEKGMYSPTDEVLPQNYYAETKLAGEYVAKSVANHLIIRLSFGPDVYPYDNAIIDQFTSRLPVSIAAKRIADAINEDRNGIIHICDKRQSVYDYALATSNGKYIKPSRIADFNFNRPKDTSLSEN